MTFIASTEDRAVIGSVTAAMTAGRSAAMVVVVSVRARPTRRVRDRTHPVPARSHPPRWTAA